ncbi:MAG TPA: hypothetical protein VH083_28300, partial [Myxococcales bacterium]|nr:hypothetical protein [Myxococcales bacterium]
MLVVQKYLLIAALFAAACGSGSAKSTTAAAPVPPPIPAGLKIERIHFQIYAVSWTPQVPPASGYDLEISIDGAPFYNSDGSGDFVAGTATISTPLSHELSSIVGRLRAVDGTVASDWGDPATATEGVLPGSILAFTTHRSGLDGDIPPIQVQLHNGSAVATDLRLDRTAVVFNRQPTNWVTLPPTDASLQSYQDFDVLDGVSYLYRVSYGKNGIFSETSDSLLSTFPLDLHPPLSVSASWLPWSGEHPVTAHVQWVNASATADTLQLLRFGTPLNVSVSPPAQAADDSPPWPFWPNLQYAVRAERLNYLPVDPQVSATVVMPPYALTGAIPLNASAPLLPGATDYLLDPAGDVHALLRDFSNDAATLYRPVNGDWETKALSSVAFLPVPAIALDSEAHPHVAYEVRVAAGADRALRHVWHDGSTWLSEDVTLEPGGSVVAFTAGSAGALHALYTRAAGDSVEYVYLDNSSGSWVRTALPALTGAAPAAVSLTVAQDGTVNVFSAGASLQLLTREADGTWASESLPDVPGRNATWFVAANQGHASVILSSVSVNGALNLFQLTPTAAGWGSPSLIA